MASRDVNLVIKATDDSSKTVEAIVKALSEFTKGLDNSAKKAEDNTSGFQLLGKSLAGIDKVLRGMSDADRLAQSLDRASKGAADLTKNAEQAGAEVERLGTAVQKAGATTSQFKSELAAVDAALTKEKASLEANVAAHKNLNSAYVEGKSARAQLETQETKLTKTLTTQQERLEKQTAKVEALSIAFQATDAPTKRMVTGLDNATQAAQKTTVAINDTKLKLDTVKANLADAGAAETDYASQVEKSLNSLTAQRESIDKLSASRKTAATTARQAASAEAALVKEYAGAQEALAGAATGAKEAGEALDVLHANIEQGRSAFAELAKAAQGPLTEAFRAQQSIVSKLNNAYQENRKALADLSALMGAVGVPTKEMADQYDRLNTISATVATAYKEQTTVLRTLRGDLSSTATTTAELAAKEELFAQSLTAGTRALAQSRSLVAQASNDTQKLVAANGQAGVSFSTIAKGARDAGEATKDLTDKTDASSEAYKRAANASRETLSFTERLKGEVLGLIVAYTGFQGVIDILSKTIDAYKTLEAATSRLNALHGGDQAAVASDLDFTRRTADKLGISFGTLADEYTKFAASTKGTVIEGQKTRDIFLSIAEAGRVNKLSLEDMSGIFLAVTQIASKGKFQLEELSGQLGDRLPGALNILADGLGITTQQLLKLTKAGEVSSDKLVDFAKELDKRYGGALAASLTTTTTALGQLQNAAFEALVQFGKAGFIEGFTDLIRKLADTLKSADFATFASQASSAFGVIASAIGLAVENFRLIEAAIGGFLALKLVPILGEWNKAFQGLSSASTGVLGFVNGFSKAVAPIEGAAAGAAASVGTLGRAFAFLGSSSVVGLAITAIGAGIAYWATAADTSTIALGNNRKLVDEVKNSYDDAGHSVDLWAEKFNKLTRAQALVNLQATQAAADAAKAAAVAPAESVARLRNLSPVGSDARRQLDEFEQLVEQFKAGTISADLYKQALQSLYDKTNDTQTGLRGQIVAQQDAADKLEDTNKALSDAKDLWTLVTGTVSQQKEVLDRLNGVVETNKVSTNEADAANDTFQKTLEKIQKTAPLIGSAFDDMKDHLTLDVAYESAVKFAKSMGEVLRLTKEYNDTTAAMAAKNVDKIFGNASNGLDAARVLIRAKESYSGQAYQDTQGPNNAPGAFRVGFGSDTTTDANGNVTKVVAGMATTLEDANRDLDRRIAGYFSTLKETIGADKFDSLTAQQQATLADLVHNYGTLPKDIAAALKNGSNADVANAILSHRDDNLGINAKRREEDAAPFQTDDTEAQSKRIDKQFDQQTKLNEASAAQTQEIADKAAAQDKVNDGLTKEGFIDAGIAELMKQNKNASQEIIDARKKALGLAFDAKQVQKDATADVKDAAAAEALVNSQMAQRNALEATYKQQIKTGDNAGADNTKVAIDNLNTSIGASIDKAQELYKQLGDSDKNTAAINRLDAVRTRLGLVANATNTATEANKAAAAASEQVNALLAKRSALEQQLSGQLKAGDTSGAEATKESIKGVNTELLTAIDSAEKMWQAIGGPVATAAITRLDAAKIKAQDLSKEAKQNLVDWTKVGEQFAGGLTDAVGNFFQNVAEGQSIGEAARDAFLKFASDFLINIGKMILQQELLNLVRSFGGVFSQVGLGAAILHGGGTVGASASSTNTGNRTVSPSLFMGAPKFHDGGLPGLKPGEVPAILKTGEEVLKGNDPRNILNGGAAAGVGGAPTTVGGTNVRIINTFDTADVVSQGLATAPGEQAIMNVIKTNRSAIRDLVNNG